MRKSASLITMDSSLASWLIEQLSSLPLQTIYTQELMQGLQDLGSGEVATLLLSIEGQVEGVIEQVEKELRFGELTIQPKSRKVLCQGEEVFLTPKEFDILYFLAQNKGNVFTKEQIYKAVWNEDYLLADSNIMAFIRKLRKKIEPNPDAPEYILTIWGVGYKFNDEW